MYSKKNQRRNTQKVQARCVLRDTEQALKPEFYPIVYNNTTKRRKMQYVRKIFIGVLFAENIKSISGDTV